MSPWEVSFGSKVRSQSSEECFLGTRKFPSLSKEQDRERERQRERREMTDWLTFSFWFGNELKIAHFCRFLARWLEAITRHKTINFPSNPRVHNLRRRKSRITTLPPISKSRNQTRSSSRLILKNQMRYKTLNESCYCTSDLEQQVVWCLLSSCGSELKTFVTCMMFNQLSHHHWLIKLSIWSCFYP